MENKQLSSGLRIFLLVQAVLFVLIGIGQVFFPDFYFSLSSSKNLEPAAANAFGVVNIGWSVLTYLVWKSNNLTVACNYLLYFIVYASLGLLLHGYYDYTAVPGAPKGVVIGYHLFHFYTLCFSLYFYRIHSK